MKSAQSALGGATALLGVAMFTVLSAQGTSVGQRRDGKHLFERETFGGNGRTCSTCHTAATGTVSPQQAQQRFQADPGDPLFLHDGSDDGAGNGASRMIQDATVLVEIPLPPNVSLADDPSARSVVVRRGVPSTLNTPALDPVLMVDGRQPDLESQAMGAIHDHAQAARAPTAAEVTRIKEFQMTDGFFSSLALRDFARGGSAPALPEGTTTSEHRGHRFFEDVADFSGPKHGLCGACHSGPMLDETRMRLQRAGVPPGTRFRSAGVSELNAAGNPVREFIFTNADNTTRRVKSPDPGRALIAGAGTAPGRFDNLNAFKIPTLWGVHKTAPYFHDNSARTLDDVVAHYARFFRLTSDPDGAGPQPPLIDLTAQDEADIVAFLRLLE